MSLIKEEGHHNAFVFNETMSPSGGGFCYYSGEH